MRTNSSPWLRQLNRARVITRLSEDVSTDVAIVGAGIAGITTAFYTLRDTPHTVTLVEGYRLAHGATGHNAGQVLAEFERPLEELAQEFGAATAVYAYNEIANSWPLLEEIYREAGLTLPFYTFPGFVGYTGYEQVLSVLRESQLLREHGLPRGPLLISKDAPFASELDEVFSSLYELVDTPHIQALLETKTTEYVAVRTHQKGTLNSALLCEQVLAYLVHTYGDRFSFYEETPIQKIVLHEGHGVLDADTHTITATKIVLCTNGFEHFSILNTHGLDIDHAFHHDVKGVVSYMSAFATPDAPPTAIAYVSSPTQSRSDPYFYLTRRPYDLETQVELQDVELSVETPPTSSTLVCIGGPEVDLEDRARYMRDDEYPDTAIDAIDTFMKHTYAPYPRPHGADYLFTWHGLMGYTPTGVRLIGPEPKNPVLLYNLGCNGIGILPSIYGGSRIARILKGEIFPASLFDPRD